MTAAQPSDLVAIAVDLVAVTRSGMTIRDHHDGRHHTLTFEGLAIGANEGGAGYTLTLPRAIAQAQGLHHAA